MAGIPKYRSTEIITRYGNFVGVGFVPLTISNAPIGADDILLSTHAAKVAPKYNSVPLTNLGDTLLKRNQL